MQCPPILAFGGWQALLWLARNGGHSPPDEFRQIRGAVHVADYRRDFVPGGTYFFIVVAEGRALLVRYAIARGIFGNVTRDCHRRWPFEVNAIVLLPEHLHAIWLQGRSRPCPAQRS